MIRVQRLTRGAGGLICHKSEIALWLVSGSILSAAASQAPANPPDAPASPVVETNGLSTTQSPPFPLPLADRRVGTNELIAPEKPADAPEQDWNWHVQNTVIGQGDFGFPARYSGPSQPEQRGRGSGNSYAGLVCRRAVMARRGGAHGRIDVAGLRPEPDASASRRFPTATPTKPAPRMPNLILRTCLSVKPSAWAANRRTCPTARSRWRAKRTFRG